MPVIANSPGRKKCRSQTGSQIVEFGAAVTLLTTIILIPLLDLVIVPVRWMMAQETVNQYARRLALSESINRSWRMMQEEPSLASNLGAVGGVHVKSVDLFLRVSPVTTGAGEVLVIQIPGQIPPDWLPDGDRAPCVYSLELSTQLEIAPAILFRGWGKEVPGLTVPFRINVSAAHEWENLGRNPSTGEFFLNE